MNLSDFSLLKEDGNNYTIGHPKGKSLTIPKQGLSDKAHQLISKLKREQNLAEGTEEDPIGQSSSLQTSPNQMLASIESDLGKPQAAPKMTAEAEQSANPQDEEIAETPDQPEAPAAPMATAAPDATQGLQKAQKSIESGVQAQQRASQQEARANAELAQRLTQLPTSDDLFKKHQEKDQILQEAMMSQKIDPDRYLHNMSTGSRIASAIGILLGGIGAGFQGAGSKNLAMESLNKAIDNDIESQKNDQSKTMNLWKMNREVMNDETQATLATQNQLLNVAKAKMMAAQTGALGPQAQQNAAQGLLQIDQQIANNNWMRSRLSGSGSPGSEQQHISEMQVMQQLNPKAAKEMEDKYLPGIGVARVPVKPEDRKAFASYNELMKQVNHGLNFISTKGAIYNPFGSDAQEAHDIQHNLQLEVGNLLGLNSINEYEAKKYEELVQNPGSWNTAKAQKSFQDFQRLIDEKKQSEMVSLGITPFKQAASDQTAIAWARANPGDPRAAQILQMTGAGQMAGR